MAKSFTEDGAAGAGDSTSGNYNSSAVGGVQMNDPGNSTPGSTANAQGVTGVTETDHPNMSTSTTQWSGGGAMGSEIDYKNGPSFTGPNASAAAERYADKAAGINAANDPFTQPGFTGGGVGFSFEDGGPVPDGDGDADGDSASSDTDNDSGNSNGAIDTSGDGSPEQDAMAKALESVDKTLQYTYSKFGLNGGNQEGDGAQQMAGYMPTVPATQSDNPGTVWVPGQGQQPAPPPQQTAGMMPTIPGNQSETPGPYIPGPPRPQPQQVAGMMPTIPGNQSETPGPYVPSQPRPRPQQLAGMMPGVPASQSESGIPPLQPAPGPLPPTNNPFGKRIVPPGPAGRVGAIDTSDEGIA